MRSVALPGLTCVLVWAEAALGGVPRPNLVPLPQEVEPLPRAVRLGADARLTCSQRGETMIRAGIEEMNRRIEALGGRALGVQDGPSRGPPQLAIVLGTPDGSPEVARAARRFGVRIGRGDPGPQGYVIRFGPGTEPRSVLLAGSDAEGALYACVTFAQMLRREGDRIVIDAANVRDWPDFRHRMVGALRSIGPKLRDVRSLDDYVAAVCGYVDFCLRFKINYITTRFTSVRPKGGYLFSNIQAVGPAARAALRRVSDYGRERGVLLEAIAYSAIDVGQGGPASELKDILRTHGVGYCWSRDEMLHRQAREYATFARDARIGLYYLHAPDITSGVGATGFGRRCALCKERWKDGERARADAHVMNIMYEEIKGLSPETAVCAVLTPYGATLDRMDAERREAILAYWRDVSALLPPDMLICVRENRRPNVAAFKESFRDHPVYFYIESVAWRGWQPLFATTPRFTGTFDFDDPRDVYFLGNRPDFAALTEAMAAHFAWNTDAPGSAPHRSYRHDPGNDGRGPPEVARNLVDAVCARLFGERAGPLVGEAVRGDVSWSFVDAPEATAQAGRDRLAGVATDIPGRERTVVQELSDVTGLLRHQVEGSDAGLRALRRVEGLLRTGEVEFDEWQKGELDFLLSYYASVRALSGVRYPELAANDAILAEDYPEAERFARGGLQAISEGQGIIEDVSKLTGGAWYRGARKVRERLEARRPRLELLARLSRGVVPEEADTPEALEEAAFVLRGRNVTTKSSGNGTVELTDRFARTPGERVLVFTRPERPWNGCSVRFDPVDARPFVERNGYLRFYVNSAGPEGRQRATMWCLFRNVTPEGKPSPEAGSGPWVWLQPPLGYERRHRKPGYVEVDALPQTWQLVSIPLKQLAGEGHAYLTGFHLNFSRVPEHDLIIADPYLVGDTQPVSVERRLDR